MLSNGGLHPNVKVRYNNDTSVKEVNTFSMDVFLTILLTSLFVPLILEFIVLKISSSKCSSLYAFRYPKYLLVIFVAGLITIIALFIWAYLSDYEPKLELGIFLFSFYSVFVFAIILQILKVLNFQVELEEEFISYRNLFGIVRRIKYEEITTIKIFKDKSNNPIKYRIYTCKKKVSIDNYMLNFHDFKKIMKKRLRKAKNAVQFV